MEQNIRQINDKEIDLADLLRQVWEGRWIILITTAVFLVMAVMYLLYRSYSGTKEYESQATLLVESPSPDSLITVTRSPLFISEVLKIKLAGSQPGPALTVAEVLDKQTKPPQGNLEGLTNRINATPGNAGILMITVKMQDQFTAKQLADSVVQKLTQFLKETQVKRAEKNQELLAEDTSKNFQVMRDASTRNLQYLSKGSSKNIQYIDQGSIKSIQYLTEESTKTIQFLTEGYLQSESIYKQSQHALADYYARNLNSPKSIDSLEVKRLNSDIKLKYNVYSGLYQQLETAKIEAKKKFEQIKIDARKQLDQARLDANKQLDQAKLDADKQFEQKKIDATKQIEQLIIDAVKKVPIINVLEPAKTAKELNVLKAKMVLFMMGFFGIIVGIGIVFGKKFWDKNFKKKVIK